MRSFTYALTLALAVTGPAAFADPGDRLAEVVTDPVRDCQAGWNENMPLIAWGADGVVAYANGASLENDGGRLGDAGLPLSLTVEDSFEAQLQSYLACETPYLRGTLGMLAAAAPVTEFDPRTEQIVFFKHSFSAGDGIVAGEGISRISDLAGQRIAIQANGPHVDFVGRILADGGLSFEDVEIVWVADLTGDGDTPSAALADGRADAAAVILPDARFLTSGGNVGTGAEGSVRGATILISTQEAASVIGDYIAVRADYFDAHRDDIARMVNIFFQAEEEMRSFMAQEGDSRRAAMATLMADEFLGGLPQEEGVFLWQDAITDGWAGNARHFGDPSEPRRFDALLEEVNVALRGADRLDAPANLNTAEWDYSALTDGLSNLDERQIAAFDPEVAAAAVQRLRRTGQLDANTKIDFEVYFEPDSTSFPLALYAEDFEEILRLASTYSGAIITVEGHSDPLHFLRREQAGAENAELRAIRTSTQNLSLDRAIAVVDALTDYAGDLDVRMNRDQFTVDGVGISSPLHNPPQTEAEWRENMRVVFRVLTVQAEATTFSPLQ
ncbi:ABC transporter substrate-binding protein [Aestuariibius sp. 2305UL40-4]|uniref:ABC transporter substrate-binding protein n=1 Tax=Aestuariibius violaceus TaxID=3234132 RepID=UPI00345E4E10